MLKSFDVNHQDHKPRTKYFLTAGGRVVRVDHDPDARNRLIVPTQDELKTILYDQTDARNRGNGHQRRGNIDFVALHANRRPRRKGSKNGVGNNHRTYENNSPVVVNGEEFPERHACLSDRPHDWRERGVKSDRCLRLKTNTPSPEHHDDSGEEDVSLFLDSFSASEMPGQNPSAAVETVATRQSLLTSPCPDNGVLEGQARKAEAAVVDTTQTTMEMSKPLAKIDLYSILAKAPPAEPRGTASHRPVGGIGCSVGPTNSNKAGKKRHKREQRSSRRLASSVVVGGDERPAFETALRLTPREEVGEYLERDPLGDEVAELNVKLQESLRRVTQDAQRHKSRQPVGVARHYAAILGERTRPLAKRLSKHRRNEHSIDDNDDTDATSSHDSQPCRATTDDCDNGHAADVFQHSCRRGEGGGEDSAESDRTSNSTRIATRHSSRKEADSETSPTRGGHDSTSGAGLDVDRGGVRWLPGFEAKLHSPVAGPPIGCGGNHDLQVPQQEQQPPDDMVDPMTTNSDYGEERFESADGAPESVSGSVAAAPSIATTEEDDSGITLGVEIEDKEHADRNSGNDVISKREDSSSCRGATGEDGVPLPKEGATASASASAAALRIEACWRGFVGRRSAKRVLRSGLLDALRSIGGGKISKVVSLTDVEREDRRSLNRALRVATQSRHQLPSQADIFECVRFVKSLQRRRARVVEARKRRWIAERRQRRESAKNVPSRLLSKSMTRAKSNNPESCARAQRQAVGGDATSIPAAVSRRLETARYIC
ncbi:unnamed protein product [Ectocarpus fasciculatus]